jgi:hypothetical protein
VEADGQRRNFFWPNVLPTLSVADLELGLLLPVDRWATSGLKGTKNRCEG